MNQKVTTSNYTVEKGPQWTTEIKKTKKEKNFFDPQDISKKKWNSKVQASHKLCMLGTLGALQKVYWSGVLFQRTHSKSERNGEFCFEKRKAHGGARFGTTKAGLDIMAS